MSRMIRLRHLLQVPLVSACLFAAALAQGVSADEKPKHDKKHGKDHGVYIAIDFHQHTTYTDGSNPIATVMEKNDKFGLDWWANSEHGGAFPRDAQGGILAGPPSQPYDTQTYFKFWDDPAVYPAGTILGDVKISGGHQQMWRWQSIQQFSFQDVLAARESYRKPIVQGLEWNVPGHEHCSTGIIAGQFGKEPNANAMAQFEYLFDANDADSSLGPKNTVNDHAKALRAAAWMQANYPHESWMVPAHVERKQPKTGTPYVGSGSYGYTISDFRDLNNAGPDVCFGFESMPGHQKESGRGGYGTSAVGGGTYGGCGIYAAKVGGLWDALLGEGRHWWLFASSDFHYTGGDFWPGEYQKTYANVDDPEDPEAIVAGMRSGNVFVVEGDLINALDFTVKYKDDEATMGQTLVVKGDRDDEDDDCDRDEDVDQDRGTKVKITIRFRSPLLNNNGDEPVVDHIDLIAGEITGYTKPGTPEYSNVASNAAVLKTFEADEWKTDEHGWNVIEFHTRLTKSTYFRLRGTNNALDSNEIDQTSENHDPALDAQGNTPEAAWKDLWFYSNPIFVTVE